MSACPRCGGTDTHTFDCRHLAKVRTPGHKCPSCAQPVKVGEFARIRAAKGRGHFELYHPTCHRATYPGA